MTAASVMPGTATAQPSYRVTDLGSLTGENGSSKAFGINDVGQIVGESSAASQETHAFV